MKRISVLAAMFFGLGVGPLSAGEPPAMRDQPHANDIGVWKSYSPKGLRGEFHNYDPVGLMAGA